MSDYKQKRRKTTKKVQIMTTALVAAACLAGCAAGKNLSSLSSKPASSEPAVFMEGTMMEGQDISGKTSDEAAKIGKAYIQNKVEKIEISVKFAEETVLLQDDDFTYKEIMGLTLPKLLVDNKAEKIDISYVVDLSEQGKAKLMEAVKKSFVNYKEATVNGFDSSAGAFQFTDEVKGRKVDVDKMLKNIRQLLTKKQGGALQAEFIEVVPHITKAALQEKFGLLGNFSTVSTNTYNGNSNMALALSRINGTKMEPGEVFSYNRTIGDSTSAANGFLPAGGISGGLIVQMYGGGICQGSTTVYNAVARAGLEIVERECHAFESTYVTSGMDAMVDYGSYDFKFRNNLAYPIYIQSWMDGTTLNVYIYGVKAEEWDTIEISSGRVETYPAPEEITYTEDPDMAKNEYRLASSSRDGVFSRAYRYFYKGGTLVRTEELPSSLYNSYGRIFTYGPGTDIKKIDVNKDRGTVEETPVQTPPPAKTSEPIPTSPPAPSSSESSASTPTSTPASSPAPSSSEGSAEQASSGGAANEQQEPNNQTQTVDSNAQQA